MTIIAEKSLWRNQRYEVMYCRYARINKITKKLPREEFNARVLLQIIL